MALKHFNPTSPSRRGLVLVDRSELHKGRPGVRSDVKKAFVTLAEGESIDFTNGLA